jgi:2,3-diketo-5-methylthio-1-phosphopentane phosphatase
MLPSVLVDFDGTVVLEDTTDLVLEQFADPVWRDVETAWIEGRIGSRECLSRQIDLVRASQAELERIADEAKIDPGFAEFIAVCRELKYEPIIGSDGFEPIIMRVLARAGLTLPIFSNRLMALGNNRWRAEFPHFHSDCASQSGNCKCMRFLNRPAPRILVGDGRSDFCPASRATYVLAKKSLAVHCRKARIEHVEINGLGDAVTALRTAIPGHLDAIAARSEAGLHA